MKNVKKALALVLVIAVAMGAGIMGTLAYLQDEDSDVNVMTMGFVSIKQHEYERVEGATATIDGVTSYVLQSFTQGKPLLPIVGDPSLPGNHPGYAGYDSIPVRMTQVGSYGGMDVFAGKNAQDKFVVVENDGITDAYIRTIVAIEVGSADPSLISFSNHLTWIDNQHGVVTIDGNNYFIHEFTYAGAPGVRHEGGILPAGETAYPSLSQVYIGSEATNEDCKALDGNGNGTLDILVLSQAVQAAGFADADTALDAAFGDVDAANVAAWFGDEKLPTLVTNAAELQAALDSAVDGDTIVFADDIDGDVTATQKANTKITIAGNGKTFAGVLTVDGKSATILSAGLTVKNLTFKADSISADACIRLGDGTNATRYTCNVTVEGCTFDVPGAVGVKSYTGGDKNLVITGCTATANAHSLAQLKGIDGVLIEKCTVNAARGVNFNNSDNIKVVDSNFSVQKYVLRFGESANSTVENYEITNCNLTSTCVEDAVIVLRAGATNANLTLTNTELHGTPEMIGHENANIVIK